RGPVEARQGAEDGLVHVPGRVPDEREAERAQRQVRAAEDLERDQHDQRDRGHRGGERQPEEQPVADPVAQTPVARQLGGGGKRAHPRPRYRAKPLSKRAQPDRYQTPTAFQPTVRASGVSLTANTLPKERRDT